MSMRYPGALLTATYNLLQVPGAPTIGTATAGSASASVTFTAPSDIGGGAITSYTVISSGGQVGTGASSPVTVSGLTNGQSYTFTVYANNAYGPGDVSAASNSVTPSAGKTVEIKVWGAGGGYGNYGSTSGENGGPGGYATATFTIVNGTTLSIFVGQGGGNYQTGGDPNGGNASTGGGGSSSGGKGGGFTGVFTGSQTWADLQSASISSSKALIIAGSGGGAAYYSGAIGGGYGGGTSGSAGIDRTGGDTPDSKNAGGGTATTGGTAGTGDSGNGTAGSLYKGGAASSNTAGAPGGGGGAGWYGGGGAGLSGSNPAGGGGGGSGMIASITSGTSLPSEVSAVTGNSFTTQTGTATTAPNNSDSDYVAGRGVGGVSSPNTNGGNGLIVVYINGVKTSYSYTGNVQTVTV